MKGELPSGERRLSIGRRSVRPGLAGVARTALPFLGLACILCAESARAQQQPAIEARRVAAYGPTNKAVTEPAIAAGPDRVVSVFFDFNYRARYATKDLSDPNATWTEGIMNSYHRRFADLSIAYELGTGEFLAAAITGTEILTNRLSDDPNEGFGPEGWLELADHRPNMVDKAWIVAGDPNMPTGQEYYITYQVGYGDAYWYLRSIHSGESWCWANDKIRVPDPNDPNDPNGIPVRGDFCAQPAVYADGPLYVAYIFGGGIHFLVGGDVDPEDPNDPNTFDCSDSGDLGVNFERLYLPVRPPNDPVELTVALNDTLFDQFLPGTEDPDPNEPGPRADFEPKLVPQLAVDPTDPDRLYIVYHDTVTNDPNDPARTDVNIYLRKLTRAGGGWTAGPRIQVNDDDATQYESDQFMPSVTVDDNGYIHIIFYDDEKYTDGPQGDLQPDTTYKPKFDVFYAWSDDAGERWMYEQLWFYPPEPALDFTRKIVDPREYIGICWYDDLVWTAYTGTYSGDPYNKAVIWSSRIDWSPP